MVHVSKGARVFVTTYKMFGDVTKVGTLGTEAVVVECDDGSFHVICGENVKDEIVDKSTSKNGRGTDVQLPTDVRVIGHQVLESFGVDDEDTRAALFQKFMVLDEAVRLEKATYWEANKDDQAKMATFLSELLTLLKEDTAFIQAKSAKLLKHLSQDTRTIMLTNMMASTTEEERRAMIMEYTSIQNDRRKVGEFLQGMYELLLDNKSYIMSEFRTALVRKKILEQESTPMIAAFLAKLSEAQQEEIVNDWRRMKLYRSTAGATYALNLVRS